MPLLHARWYHTPTSAHTVALSLTRLVRGGCLRLRYLFSDGGKGLDEPEMIAKCRASQEGSKWTLTAFAQWAFDNGHDASLIWKRLAQPPTQPDFLWFCLPYISRPNHPNCVRISSLPSCAICHEQVL